MYANIGYLLQIYQLIYRDGTGKYLGTMDITVGERDEFITILLFYSNFSEGLN